MNHEGRVFTLKIKQTLLSVYLAPRTLDLANQADGGGGMERREGECWAVVSESNVQLCLGCRVVKSDVSWKPRLYS